MFTPLSIQNLLDGGWRTFLSVVGIGIAVVLIFMQLGFLGAVLETAIIFYRNMDFDLVARSPDYYQFVDTKTFDRDDLLRLRNGPGVVAAHPFQVSLGKWNYAERSVQRGILVMGVPRGRPIFQAGSAGVEVPDTDQLVRHDQFLMDRTSRPRFLGRNNRRPFGPQDVGMTVEINGRQCEMIGLFKIGTGLAADGAAIVNEEGYRRVFPNHSRQEVCLGLIQLDAQDAEDPIAARNRIMTSLGWDDPRARPIELLTRREAEWREIRHWMMNTPVGFIFIAGVVVAFIVGAIIVYIVLSADISRQLGEYATLKAMGYRNRYLSRVVLEQAFILGVVSYALAFVISLVLYQVVGDLAKLPITMTWTRQAIVFVSVMTMCGLSGSIAMQKLRRADPADLF